jgi:hypothetical protein
MYQFTRSFPAGFYPPPERVVLSGRESMVTSVTCEGCRDRAVLVEHGPSAIAGRLRLSGFIGTALAASLN